MSNAVVVNQVTKEFGKPNNPIWKRMFMGKSAETNGHKPKKVKLVDQVSFAVQEGEIFGVLGPNGSGKSTLIRLIATLLLPDGGDIQVFGFDVVCQPMKVQQVINRVSVEASFFKKTLADGEPDLWGTSVRNERPRHQAPGGGDSHPPGIGGTQYLRSDGRDVARDAAKGRDRQGAAFQASNIAAG